MPNIVNASVSRLWALFIKRVDTEGVLNWTVFYALLSGLLLLSYILIVSGLSLLLARPIPADNPYLVGFVVILLALSLNPLRTHLHSFMDHVFTKGQSAHRERLEAFERGLAQTSDLPTVTSFLHQHIQSVLSPRPCHIYIYDSLSEHYASAPDGTGKPTSDICFPAVSPLPQLLMHRSAPLILGNEDPLPAALKPEHPRLALLAAHLFVPLSGQQSLVGWLALGLPGSGNRYQRADLAFLDSLAEQAARAIERLQVVADLERRVTEMNVLTRLADGINVTLAFDDLLELFYAQTNHLIPTQDFRITLRDRHGRELYYAFYLDNDVRLEQRENQALQTGYGLDAEVVRIQRSILTDDYERECRARGLLSDTTGVFSWIGVPLTAGAETIGAVSLGSRDPSVVFTPQQASLLEAIVDLAAGAIMKARLLEETERRARQLSMLNEIAQSLTSTLELDPLLNNILQNAVDLLNCEAGSLLLVDENTGESVFKVAVGPVGADLVGQRLPPGAGLVGKAVKTGQPIIQNDVRRSKEWFDTDQQTGYRTQDLLVVPMQVKERIIGVLEVLNKRDGSTFSEDDQELLSGFAGQAAIAIENARLYTLTDQALADRVEELSVMQRIDQELNASLDLERAMRITLEWAMRQSHAQAGLVGFLTADGVRVMASLGYHADPHVSSQDDSPPTLPLLEELICSGQQQSTATQLLVPIRREARVIGVLMVEGESVASFAPETRNFLSRLSDHAAIAIANAQLYEVVQAASLAKSQFVSAAAHELKNPLTSIKGYSDLLVAGAVGPVNEGQAGFLATIRSNADRMSILVSDLQDLSRIEAGQLRLKFSPVAIHAVVEEVIHSLRRQIEEREQVLEIAVPAELPPVWGDRDRLIQILTNLVSNAYKYTPRGGRIFVQAVQFADPEAVEPSSQYVYLHVQDTGIGISPDDQRRIFQQFFRSDDPRVREVTGTGLGLSITKNLVEMQGGRIWFESLLGQGTTFHCTVPVANPGATNQEARQ